MKMEPIEGSETSAFINQTPGNYPKGNLLYSVHGESLKSRIIIFIYQSTMGSTLYSAGQSKRTLNLREQIQTRKHFMGSSRGVSVPLKKFWFLC
jgi:hypothetical protein